MTATQKAALSNGWTTRLKALRNIPSMLVMVWASGPLVVSTSLLLRLFAAVIPISMLSVSRLIVDAVVASTSRRHALPRDFWWVVSLEFALAAAASVLGRAIGFCDSLFADRFTRYISVRVMEHASTLDLASYENPEFYDKPERARAQATDRIAMIREAGSLVQQAITVATLSAGILIYSPWLLFALIACLVPAFLGETHFAFLGYSLNFGQTCMRRQMDYFRTLGASKESAKELKLFGLSPFFVGRYSELSDQIYGENRTLAKRRVWAGSLLSLLSSGGYYAAYAYVIYRHSDGQAERGHNDLPLRIHCRDEHEHPEYFFLLFMYCRPIAFPDGSSGIFFRQTGAFAPRHRELLHPVRFRTVSSSGVSRSRIREPRASC